jgi:hypothetical protein
MTSSENRRRLALALGALVWCGATPPLLGARQRIPAAAARVRTITIDRRNIFDRADPAEDRFFHRVADRLHVLTRERVIRQYLLFKEGDRYDPALARETERVLRRVLPLRTPRVTALPAGPGLVDVTVRTDDTWTTEPSFSVSGVGSQLSGRAGLREKNWLGLGKDVGFVYRKTPDATTRSFFYSDPGLWGTRWRLLGSYADTEGGALRGLGIEKPFLASITPFAVGAAGTAGETRSHLLDGGEKVADFDHRDRSLTAFMGASLGSTPRHIRRAGVRYRYQKNKLFPALPISTPLLDRRWHSFGLFGEVERVKFLTTTRFDRYDRDEDFRLGPALSAEWTRARKTWVSSSDDADFLSGNFTIGRSPSAAELHSLTLTGDGRLEKGSWRNTRALAEARYFLHPAPRHTLALHAKIEGLAHPDPDVELLLGGDRGLRGYPLNEFSGNRLVLFNAEERVFLVDDIGRLAALGAAVFADGGGTWKTGRAVRWQDLRADVGAGLRFHLTRTSEGHVLRLDAAYALHPLPGVKPWVFTFGAGQAF